MPEQTPINSQKDITELKARIACLCDKANIEARNAYHQALREARDNQGLYAAGIWQYGGFDLP